MPAITVPVLLFPETLLARGKDEGVRRGGGQNHAIEAKSATQISTGGNRDKQQ